MRPRDSELLPLLLSRPDLAPAAVLEANSYLSGVGAFNLRLFYTAAMLLQQTYRSKLDELLGQRQPLPDLFGEKLAITAIGSSETRLRELGERHKALIGVRANWVGTYHHGAKRLIKRVQILSSPTSHIISLKVYGATFFRFDACMAVSFSH